MAQLYYREYGSGPPLIILHGLLGSGSNWTTQAKWLAEECGCRVILPDMRNHGRSPHLPDTSYLEMTRDVSVLMDRLDLAQAIVAGHSMGGKIAMLLALTEPQRVQRLCPIDIAPVAYPPRHLELLDTMASLGVERMTDREEVDAALATTIDSPRLRQFVMTNLKREGNFFSWRVNLPLLLEKLPEIWGFDLPDLATPFPGDTFFIDGANSKYIEPQYLPIIKHWFPAATIGTIPDAGHWVQADQPERFRNLLKGWLEST